MYCRKCGTENEDGVRFCKKCGTEFQQPATSSPVTQAPADKESKQPKAPNSDKKKLFIIIGAAVVTVIVVIAIIVGIMMAKDNEAKHALHPVTISIVAPGYTEAATRIPVNVVGKDIDGKEVNQTYFIGADGRGIELMRGDYELLFPASPFLPDAHFYKTPEKTLKLTIDDKVQNSDGVAPDNNEQAVFTEANIMEITQAQLDAASKYAEQDPQSAEKAKPLREALVAEKDRLVKEEEERKAREALRAKYHISTDYYEVDIPEYWYDRVDWSIDGKGLLKIYPIGSPDNVLCSISVVPQSQDLVGGDVATSMLWNEDASNGKRVEFWGSNWAWRFFFDAHSKYQTYKLGQDQKDELIDLSTGGEMSYQDAIASEPGTSGYAFYKSEIIPTVIAK